MRELLLRHIYSGDAALTAAVLVSSIAAVDAGGLLKSRSAAAVARVTFITGVVLGLLAGAPLSLWIAVPLIFALAVYGAWLLRDADARYRKPAAAAVVLLAAAAASTELSHRIGARTDVPPFSRLVVVGDSLVSGGFGEEHRWLDLLQDRWGIRIIDVSRASNDVAAAAAQLRELERANGAGMLLVIGGNDMIAGRPGSDFGRALKGLISEVDARGYHPLIMLELPVLPGRWSYAQHQRKIAREHEVILIPKSVLASVLADPRNTSDGVHLTQRGHEEMAEELARALGLERP